MSVRLDRKTRPYDLLKIKSSGGLLDLFDNAIKEAYRITDEEYDYLCEKMNDEEVGVFVGDPNLKTYTFTDRRTLLQLLNKYLTQFEIEKNGEQ